MSKELPDVQKSISGFPQIPLYKVGVRGIKVPFKIKQKGSDEYFSTIATVSSYCSLSETVKGINMSRIGRSINLVLSKNDWGFNNLNEFATELQQAHDTNNIWIKAKFDYIYKTVTPMTNITSFEPVKVTFESKLINGVLKNYISIDTVEMSLCPCSKEMSLLINNLTVPEVKAFEYLEQITPSGSLIEKIKRSGFGAHNQKSMINVKVEINRFQDEIIWIEDIVEIIQKSVSSPTWSTLKRPDEKYVTEVSYMGSYIDEDGKFVEVGGGPKFVEDIGREIAEKLNNELDRRILDYCVVVNNQESIHSDNIVATSVVTANRSLN